MHDLRLTVEGGVATIAIDRPQARNALSTQTMRELDEALAGIGDRDVKVLVIRGAGNRAFCAGGDLKELEHMRSEAKAAEMANANAGHARPHSPARDPSRRGAERRRFWRRRGGCNRL